MNILLLEDDKQLNRAITKFLTLKGLNVSSFYDGEDVLKQIGGYDLYLLDINTPNISGIDILKYINNSSKSAKVIMISANIDIKMMKSAYDNGCYDYLKKPFQIEELFFKIEKIEKELNQNVLLENGLEFDTENRILYRNKQELELTKKEMSLFNLLSINLHNIVTYEQIEFEVYNNESTAVSTIRALVKRLREKVGKETVKTVINVGYKL